MLESRVASLIVLCTLIPGNLSGADDGYRGAQYVLDEVRRSTKEDKAEQLDPAAQRWVDLDKLIRERGEQLAKGQDSGQAAKWIELMEKVEAARGWRMDSLLQEINFDPGALDRVYGQLPSPLQWAELVREIDARPIGTEPLAAIRGHAMRLIGHVLSGDQAAQRADAQRILQTAKENSKRQVAVEVDDSGRPSPFAGGRMLERALQVVRLTGSPIDPDEMLRLWELQLSLRGEYDFGNVPDLVMELGADRATPLLLTFLRRSRNDYLNVVGEGTQAAVKKLVIEHFDELHSPPVNLLVEIDDLPTLEKLIKSKSLGDNFQAQQLPRRYVTLLMLAGRVDDAKAFILAEPERFGGQGDFEMWSQGETTSPRMNEAEYQLYDTLRAQIPTLAIWLQYLQSATKVNQGAEAIKHAKAFLGANKLSPAANRKLKVALADACLADEQVDEALAILKDLLVAGAPADEGDEGRHEMESIAVKLLKLGKILPDQAIVDFASEKLVRLTQTSRGNRNYGLWYGSPTLADLLASTNHHREAEALLVNNLRDAVKRAKEARANGAADMQECSAVLAQLAKLYHDAGRGDDVLALAANAPWWGTADAGQLPTVHGESPDVTFYIAAALAAKGRKEVAVPLLYAALDGNPNKDDYYELLLKTEGAGAAAKLDLLFARSPFEERPLIWKAKLLLGEGKLDDAEKTARQAIAIDPSDGEQGKGHRMLVYSVLADILEKRGDAKSAEEAAIYRGAVKAIRLAEDADDARGVGLHRRAVRQYLAALKLFDDAYCIQSRVAMELAEMGKVEEATQHYQRAFELMPVSFGRVESHCFGCEGIFRGLLAQMVAERTLSEFIRQHPDNPRAHYLLGKLHEEQKQPVAALANYRQAVKLDADYYNAWVQVAELARKLDPPGDQDAELKVLRLQPFERYHEFHVEAIRDLPRLWAAVAEVQGRTVAPGRELWAFPASARLLEELKEENPSKSPGRRRVGRRFHPTDDEGTKWPGPILVNNVPILKAVGEILNRQF